MNFIIFLSFFCSLYLCLPTWSFLDGFLNAALEESVKVKPVPSVKSVQAAAKGSSQSGDLVGSLVDNGHIVIDPVLPNPASQSLLVRHRNSMGKEKIE